MKLSIVSPSYNEVGNLTEFVEQIQNILIKKFKTEEFEIIIVDDNSLDGSNKILKNLKEKYKNFHYFIRKDSPRDLSRSCLLGFENANFDNILVLDCDLQHDPKDILKLIDQFQSSSYNVVVGARNLFAKVNGLSLFRQFASVLIIIIFNTLLKKQTNDPMSGFFIFKKKLFLNSGNFFGKGFKILIDLIYNTNEKVLIKDVHIDFKLRKANESKMNAKILFYIIEFTLRNFFKRLIK